ncbi:hypothetical protein H4R34_005753, partial [Dimargaris verticillata]
MSLEPATGKSSDPMVNHDDADSGTASANQHSAAARDQELHLFGRLIDELETGLQKRDPIDWTRLVDYSRNWRKHVPDDVVPELSTTHLREFHDATDQMITTAAESPEATSTRVSSPSPSSPPPSSASGYSSATTQGRLPRSTKMAPHELPLEELSQQQSSGQLHSTASTSHQASNNLWLNLMLQLVPPSQRKQYLDRLSPGPSSPSSIQKRTYATKAAQKKKLAAKSRGEPIPPSSKMKGLPTMPFTLNRRGKYAEDLQVLYYPPELYQRLVPAQTPTEAFQSRQLRPQRMGTPVPLSHPLVDRTAQDSSSGLGGDEKPKPETALIADKTTADFVDYNDLQRPTQASPSTDPSGSYEFTATSTITLPLEPGDLVDIFAVDQSIPQFGVVLASSLPETGSSQYQVLTMTHQVLTVTDRSISFWIPGFIFSNASVLETCWRNYCRDHPRYHMSVSREVYKSYLKKGFRDGSRDYLAPTFSGASDQRLATDLQHALPTPDNILRAIPALRFAMNQWRQQIETWYWSHHFHYEGLYDSLWNSVQPKAPHTELTTPTATAASCGQAWRPVTQADPTHPWDSSDWDPN